MNKMIKNIVSVAIMCFLCFSAVTLVTSCKGNQENPRGTAQAEESVETDEFSSEFEDDFFEDSETVSVEEELPIDEDFDTDYEAVDNSIEDVEETKTTRAPKKVVPSSTKSYSDGIYMVLAGSYLIKGNAEKMMSRLKGLGYEAEVVIFDYSQYYSVCAARLSGYNSAVRVSNELKSKGIDNYVHKKQ